MQSHFRPAWNIHAASRPCHSEYSLTQGKQSASVLLGPVPGVLSKARLRYNYVDTVVTLQEPVHSANQHDLKAAQKLLFVVVLAE